MHWLFRLRQRPNHGRDCARIIQFCVRGAERSTMLTAAAGQHRRRGGRRHGTALPGLPVEKIPRVCQGGEAAGPIGKLSQAERFHWLVAPRSTVVQTSPVHSGLCDDPAAALEHLEDRLAPAGSTNAFLNAGPAITSVASARGATVPVFIDTGAPVGGGVPPLRIRL